MILKTFRVRIIFYVIALLICIAMFLNPDEFGGIRTGGRASPYVAFPVLIIFIVYEIYNKYRKK